MDETYKLSSKMILTTNAIIIQQLAIYLSLSPPFASLFKNPYCQTMTARRAK